jgi:hypothetical protein
MHTESVNRSLQMLTPPVVLLRRLLLTETCSAARLTIWRNLAPDLLAIRATKVSALLEDTLAQTGYRHGGIND